MFRTSAPSFHHSTAWRTTACCLIFFDYPAGTQVPQPVIDAVAEYYLRMNANSGGSFSTSRRSDTMVQAARERVADFLYASRPEEIVFGPNMTTLNFALSRALGKTLSPGDEIVLTQWTTTPHR